MEMAAKRGFAEREGLKLELVEFKDDPIGLKALLAGEIDSYEGGVQGPIAADVRGGDIKIIGCYWPIVPHGLMVKNNINSVEDLKGKSIAVSSPGSFPDMLARVALAKYNFKASDVTLAAVGSDRDRYSALVGGVVDAAVVSNEYLPLPTSKGLKMLLTGKDAGRISSGSACIRPAKGWSSGARTRSAISPRSRRRCVTRYRIAMRPSS